MISPEFVQIAGRGPQGGSDGLAQQGGDATDMGARHGGARDDYTPRIHIEVGRAARPRPSCQNFDGSISGPTKA